MDERHDTAARAWHAFEFLPQQVLDGLDVVVGLGLELFDPLRVVDAEFVDDRVQHVLHGRFERCELADARLVGKPLKPADLDQHAVADEGVFGEVFAKRRSLARIAAVERRKCQERRGVHRPLKPIQAISECAS